MDESQVISRQALADRALFALAGLALSYVAWVLWTYLRLDGYLDHMEPNVAIPAWLWLSGRSIYPAADRPIEFLTTFGPMVYLLNASILAIVGGSIMSSKIGGVLAAGGALALAVVALRHVRPPSAIAVAALTMAGFLLLNMPAAFWNRPDSFLLLLATVGFYLLRRVEHGEARRTAAVILGIAIGLSVNLKAHAFLYFIPAMAWFIADERTIRGAVLTTLRIGVPSVAVFLLPFALPGISLIDYASEMLALIPAVTHGEEVAMKVLRFSILYLVPAAAFLLFAPSAPGRERWRDRAYGMTFVVSLAALFYPATTTGAGIHHLMPLTPFAVDFLARLWAAKDGFRTLRRIGIAIFAIAIVAMSVPKQRQLHRQMDAVVDRGVAADIRAILAKHPGRTIEMGYGASFDRYQDSFLRPILIFAGNPFSFEAMTFMELRNLAQIPPSAHIQHIESCASDLWLIPKGEAPFALGSYYDGKSAFGDALPHTFLKAYEKSDSSRYFDLWSCIGRREPAGESAPR